MAERDVIVDNEIRLDVSPPWVIQERRADNIGLKKHETRCDKTSRFIITFEERHNELCFICTRHLQHALQPD